MISKNKIRFINSLQQKKIRDDKHLFVIEGDKIVREYLSAGSRLHILAATQEFIDSLLPGERINITEIEAVRNKELKAISTLKTPHNALAVAEIPFHELNEKEVFKGLSVALDFIQDPGNLGTIIRAAAWFGMNNIVCSENCADAFNPKVVQASMGALLNVKIHYSSLIWFLGEARKEGLEVYGTFPEGESIYKSELGNDGIIILGNESKGISSDLTPLVTKKLTVPKFTKAVSGIESLNVGMAASVVFSEFARRRIE